MKITLWIVSILIFIVALISGCNNLKREKDMPLNKKIITYTTTEDMKSITKEKIEYFNSPEIPLL